MRYILYVGVQFHMCSYRMVHISGIYKNIYCMFYRFFACRNHYTSLAHIVESKTKKIHLCPLSPTTKHVCLKLLKCFIDKCVNRVSFWMLNASFKQFRGFFYNEVFCCCFLEKQFLYAPWKKRILEIRVFHRTATICFPDLSGDNIFSSVPRCCTIKF